MDFYIIAESFETSVAWDRCESLCRNVKLCMTRECDRANIKKYMMSCRVTQSYDAGACVYFYFGFNYTGFTDPVEIFEAIEHHARDEILASGGSLSHHHGIGKCRKQWYAQTVSSTGVKLFQATKKELDPKNIFAVGNVAIDETDIEGGHNEIVSINSKL